MSANIFVIGTVLSMIIFSSLVIAGVYKVDAHAKKLSAEAKELVLAQEESDPELIEMSKAKILKVMKNSHYFMDDFCDALIANGDITAAIKLNNALEQLSEAIKEVEAI